MTGSNSELPRERGDKGAERTFGVMGMYADLTAVMVSWVITCVKAHQTAHLKNVQFTVYQLYLNKTFFFKCYSFRTRGIGFTHLTQATRRVGKLCKTVVMTHRTRQRSTGGEPERRNKGSGPGLAPGHRLESFQASAQTHRSRTKPVVALGWEGRVCSSERQVTRTDGREEKRRERRRDLQGLPSKASAQFCPGACRWGKAKVYREKEGGTTPGAHPGLRRTHISTSLQGWATSSWLIK